MTLIEEIAGWAAEVDLPDIPADVVALCDAQRQSVLAGIEASSGDEAADRVAAAVDDPLYAAAARSIALDFDDYLCFGHTGHSAVLVPEFVGAEIGASETVRRIAQVVANEVGARMGGACIVGPLNGQLWSFVHAAGSALAGARLFDLDAGRTAHALALALTNAPRPTVPGFMAPDSKLLTAAEPILTGVRAARLAVAGVTGPLDVLDHPQGFLSAFAYVPLRSMFGGLGDGWATQTLCVKPYPGCAYLDTVLDALVGMGPFDAESVESVRVDAGILTCGMNDLSAPYAADRPTPVTVTFSVPWNVAIVLLAGRLTPAEVNAAWLDENSDRLDDLRGRVEVCHDWEATRRTARAFAPLLPPRVLAREAGAGAWLRGVARLRDEHRALSVGARSLAALVTVLRRGGSFVPRSLPKTFWDPDALEAFEMTFPARVEVTFRDGRREEASVDIPRGAAGNVEAGPAEVAAEKAAATVEGAAQRR